MLLVTASAATILASCGGSTTGANMKEIMNRKDVENYKYPEQIELKIPVYDRGTPGQASVTDNYWTKYVQSKFGDKHNIKVTFISIPRKEEITAFNQLLAGKQENQPDIIFNYDYPSIVSFANQDAFQEISVELLEKYAPKYYERTKHLDKYTVVDGEKLFLAGTRPQAYNYVSIVRKDWMEKCGLTEYPKTEEEYVNMLKMFRDKKLGGENTIPLTKSLPNANYGNYTYRPYPMPEEENALYSDITVASLTYEPTKKQLQFDNMLFNEKLVSPEWDLDKDGNKMMQAFISGQAGIYGTYLTKNPDIIGSLKKNVPDAEVMIVPSMENKFYPGKYPARADNPFGLVTGINVNCTHPEAVLMYFEWLNNPENLFAMQNGLEGVTYTLEDGVPVLIDGYKGEERLNYNSNKDMWCLVIEGKDLGSDEKNLLVQKKTFAPAGYEYLIQQSYDNFQKTKADLYPDFIFTKPVTSLASLGETLKSKWQVSVTTLTNCKPEEFEAKYEAACKEYLDAGYKQVLEEKKALYDEQKKAEK